MKDYTIIDNNGTFHVIHREYTEYLVDDDWKWISLFAGTLSDCYAYIESETRGLLKDISEFRTDAI